MRGFSLRTYCVSWKLSVLVFGLPWLVSCSGAPVVQGDLPVESAPPKVVLEPGDEIEVRFAYWPDMDDVQFIREDGNVSLQLIDDVHVAGLTPLEADQKLTELYQAELKNPEITVIVRSRVGATIYVGGEVRQPGPIPLAGKMNLLEAIVAGGGFDNETANTENVIVYRQKGEKVFARSFNAEEVLYSPESLPLQLEPNDVVYVTRSGISKANQWVEQHINRMIPGGNLLQSVVLYTLVR